MAAEGWPVSDFWLETPSYARGPHDLRGKGRITIDKDGVHATIRPRGLAGIVIPTKERRTFPIQQITGWDRTGSAVEFTAGAIAIQDSIIGGLITTTGASVPVHVCRFTCQEAKDADEMTRALVALGLDGRRVAWH